MLDKFFKDNPLYIVDIGASGGIHSRWKRVTKNNIGVLFEPDPREYEILKSQGPKNARIFNTALGEKEGHIIFNLCKKNQVSSGFIPNYPFLSRFKDVDRFEIVNKISIPIDSLDNQLKKHKISRVHFLKIDTQGHELDILKGSGETLSNTFGLEIEVEFASIYEEQPLFNEVNSYILNYGFELFDLKRHYWKRKNSHREVDGQKGQLIFADALYFKSPERVCADPNLKEEDVIYACGIYLAYGYIDLIHEIINRAINSNLFRLDGKEYINELSKITKAHNFPFFSKLFRRICLYLSKIFKIFGDDINIGNSFFN